MIRAIVVLMFVCALAASPVYLLERTVLPQLALLKQTYGSGEAVAARVSGTAPRHRMQ